VQHWDHDFVVENLPRYYDRAPRLYTAWILLQGMQGGKK
jgi:hypothetical protein